MDSFNKIYIVSLALFLTLPYSCQNTFAGQNQTVKQTKVEHIPSFPKGKALHLTFKSNIDGSFQPMLVKTPVDYTPDKTWPLLVALHGLGSGPILAPDIESMIQIGPFGRGDSWYEGIGEQDVLESIEHAKRLFKIDPDRIYLCGFSMGAVGTFRLGFRYPDMWAACAPVCGRFENLDFVENARHLPFWIHSGANDEVIEPEYSGKIYEKAQQLGFSEWKYTKHKGMGHSFRIDWPVVEKWLLTKKSKTNPKQVSFCTKDIKANRAYWAEIKEIEKSGKPAKIQVAIEGQHIKVITSNVHNYTLNLNNILIDCKEKVQIIENGICVFDDVLDESGRFEKQ